MSSFQRFIGYCRNATWSSFSLVFGIVILSFVVANVSVFFYLEREMQGDALNKLHDKSLVISEAVSHFFTGRIHTVLLLEQYEPFRDYLRQCDNSEIAKTTPLRPICTSMLTAADRMYRQIKVKREAGNWSQRASTDDEQGQYTEADAWLASVEGNFFFRAGEIIDEHTVQNPWNTRLRPWYPTANAASTDEIAIPDSYIDIEQAVACVSIIKKIEIKNEKDEVVRTGFVGVDVYLGIISQIMQNTRFASTEKAVLIDGSGTVVYHPDYRYDPKRKLGHLGKGYENLFSTMKNTWGGTISINLDDHESLIGYAKVDLPGADWYVLLISPKVEAERDMAKRYRLLMGIGLIDLILVLIPIGLFLVDESRKKRQFAKAKVDAETANWAKSEFLAHMSHEIRTPINGVIGLSDLMIGTKLDAKQAEYTRFIKASAQSLLFLINDILDFSKIEAGKLELDIDSFDLMKTVETVIGVLATRADEKKIELCTSFSRGLPRKLQGDAGRIRQILLNLLGNAMKFTETGGVRLHIQIARKIVVQRER